MPSTMTACHATRRSRPPVRWLVALLVAPVVIALPGDDAHAQQRVRITTGRASVGEADPAERLVRRLRLRADSLARLYGHGDELSVTERQQLGGELDRTIEEIERALAAMERTTRVSGVAPARVAPMQDPRAADRMARTLAQGRGGAGGGAGTPRGWLGIVVNGVALEPRIERGELFVHYLTYPEILSVEPSSPAERAGIVPGDTLIAYDGRDVRDVDISMTRLLRPNARVQVRIARDGRRRDVPVTIADAPSRIVLRAEEMRGMVTARAIGGTDPMGRVLALPSRRAAVPAMRASPVVGLAPAAPVAPAPSSVAGVAGAHMGSLTAEWARLTGVSHGVLVHRAPAGSIAAESGLRDADVIVRAAGREVRTLNELRDLLAMAWTAGDRALAIEYVRDRASRTGSLRW